MGSISRCIHTAREQKILFASKEDAKEKEMILIAFRPWGMGRNVAEGANWGSPATTGNSFHWGERVAKSVPQHFPCRAMSAAPEPKELRKAMVPLIRQLVVEGHEYSKVLAWAHTQVQAALACEGERFNLDFGPIIIG